MNDEPADRLDDPRRHSLGNLGARELALIALLLRWMLGLAVVGVTLWLLSDVLLTIFAGVLFAVLVHGLARLLHQTLRLPYWAALSLVVLVGIGLVALLAWYAGPRLADQFTELRHQLVAGTDQLRDTLGKTNWGRSVLRQLPPSLSGDAGSLGQPPNIAGHIAGVLGSVFGVLSTLFIVFVAGLYFAASPGVYVNGMMRLLPPSQRGAGRRIADRLGTTLWHWLAGQSVDMLCVGILTGVGLALLGVPLALVLGVVSGLLNFVPYIGAITGSVPAILVALSQGPQQALYVAILYAVIQGFEGNVLAPIIQRRAVDLPPALTILSQTVIGALFGLPGLILATPLTAIAVAALQELRPGDEPAEDERQADRQRRARSGTPPPPRLTATLKRSRPR